MAKSTKNSSQSNRKRPPAVTPEGRLNQIKSDAYDLLESRIRNGTATSQELTTIIKMDMTKTNLEAIKLEHEVAVLKAKKEQMDSAKRVEELYTNAITAMRSYSGAENNYEDEPY